MWSMSLQGIYTLREIVVFYIMYVFGARVETFFDIQLNIKGKKDGKFQIYM